MTHKKENCAKRQRCFHCSFDKHDTNLHAYTETTCSDPTEPCPYPPKCIVCNGPHMVDHENCPLKPTYSKAKGAITRLGRAGIVRIRGQQKLARDWLIKDNLLQIEVERQETNSHGLTTEPKTTSGEPSSLNKW